MLVQGAAESLAECGEKEFVLALGEPDEIERQLARIDDVRAEGAQRFSQTDLIWEKRVGGIDQTLLLGFEVGQQKSRQRRQNGFFQPSDSTSLVVPLGDPTIDADIIFRPLNANGTAANRTRSKANIAAVYVQDQIRLSPMFEIVAGLRYDRFELDVTNLNNGAEFSRNDDLWSPRLGLIFGALIGLGYFAHGLTEAIVEPAVRWLGAAEVVLVLILIGGCRSSGS